MNNSLSDCGQLQAKLIAQMRLMSCAMLKLICYNYYVINYESEQYELIDILLMHECIE